MGICQNCRGGRCRRHCVCHDVFGGGCVELDYESIERVSMRLFVTIRDMPIVGNVDNFSTHYAQPTQAPNTGLQLMYLFAYSLRITWVLTLYSFGKARSEKLYFSTERESPSYYGEHVRAVRKTGLNAHTTNTRGRTRNHCNDDLYVILTAKPTCTLSPYTYIHHLAHMTHTTRGHNTEADS